MAEEKNLQSPLLDALEAVIRERRGESSAEESYVASLFAAGDDGILKKIGEEATELVMAGKDRDPRGILHETADLWFHAMILLVQNGLSYRDVLQELARRAGVSGITEKRNRPA